MEENKTTEPKTGVKQDEDNKKIKTRNGSGFLRQLYSTAKTTANSTHSNLKNLTTFMVNFIPVEKIDASELQVRVHFDKDEIDGLSHSIKTHGVLQPILVVQNGDRYKVIAGERRLRATKQAGIDRIPARVVTSDDQGTHEIALRENLDRMDLHPLEEGEGYVSLLETKAYTSYDSIAKAFGKPKSRVTECIGFTKLPTDTKQELLKRGISRRAVLRELLKTEPVEHRILMEKHGHVEDVLNQEGAASETGSEVKATEPVKAEKTEKPKEVKPFEFKLDEKSVAVPGFRWKVGEGPERLQSYVTQINKMLGEVKEKKLTE